MRCVLALVLILWLSVTGAGFPHRVFPGVPGAVSLGDPGRTSVSVAFSEDGPILEIGRAFDRRLDVWARVGTERLFSLWARAVVLQDLGPLSVALDFAAESVRLDACLFLGPVHVDWGRSFETIPRRWGILTVSPNPWLSLVLGVELMAETGTIIAGARGVPWGCGPVFSLFLKDRRLTVSVEVGL